MSKLAKITIMAKSKVSYICTSCDAIYPAWQGKCTSCNEWNTIVRDNFDGSKLSSSKSKNLDIKTHKLDEKTVLVAKKKLAVNTLNTVLGGGLVDGQVILFAGEPGIGKSTLLTQLCIHTPIKVLYISGEESIDQISKRASRLAKIDTFENADFSNDVDLESILAHIKSKDYDLIIIDSIQTVHSNDVSGYPGSMNQIRECANYITEYAKKSSVSVIMIGQITKEGNIAGPKLLEHMVDTVLYFEGDKKNDTRMLKVVKNRFGSTNEIAIFEMHSEGLRSIEDIERYFVQEYSTDEGVAYTIFQEGSLSMVLEIQALCTKSSFAYPKRVSNGYDSKRLEMLIAILMKKLNLKLENFDIYVSVVGGVKIDDTSADLAVAMAIVSSLNSKALPLHSCYIGELSLTGEVRAVNKQDQRISKAKQLGFTKAFSSENMKRLEEYAKGKR
jgi:DNA repair protein RadA/Sms